MSFVVLKLLVGFRTVLLKYLIHKRAEYSYRTKISAPELKHSQSIFLVYFDLSLVPKTLRLSHDLLEENFIQKVAADKESDLLVIHVPKRLEIINAEKYFSLPNESNSILLTSISKY
jgi:hypothetical protein